MAALANNSPLAISQLSKSLGGHPDLPWFFKAEKNMWALKSTLPTMPQLLTFNDWHFLLSVLSRKHQTIRP